MAVTLLASVAIVGANLLVDLIAPFVDPRRVVDTTRARSTP